jgi:hypothetical protein
LPNSNYKVRIIATDGSSVADLSDGTFALVSSTKNGEAEDRSEDVSVSRMVDGPILEEVLPLSAEVSLECAVPQETILGLRLSAEEPIDPASAWATLEIEGEIVEGGSWRATELGDNLDGWVLIGLPPDLADGTVVVMTAGASTVESAQLEPVSAEFHVAGQHGNELREHGEPSLVEDGGITGVPESTATPASPVYRIGPAEVFSDPVTIQIPIAEGTDPGEVEIFYFSESTAHPGWYHADDVVGWLAPDSVQIVDENGKTFAEFQTNHSGVVQLAVRRSDVKPAGIGVFLGMFLVIGVYCGRSMHRPLSRRD